MSGTGYKCNVGLDVNQPLDCAGQVSARQCGLKGCCKMIVAYCETHGGDARAIREMRMHMVMGDGVKYGPTLEHDPRLLVLAGATVDYETPPLTACACRVWYQIGGSESVGFRVMKCQCGKSYRTEKVPPAPDRTSGTSYATPLPCYVPGCTLHVGPGRRLCVSHQELD